MFYVLKPITAKRAAEVAFQLVDIFLLLGSPANLQIDNGSEFTASVITDLKQVWPKLALVHGKPRHPQNKGSLERGNGDIEVCLLPGLQTTQDWNAILDCWDQICTVPKEFRVPFCTPYSAMFGCEARVGLTSMSLPSEVINTLTNEDDLADIVGDSPTALTGNLLTPVYITSLQPCDTSITSMQLGDIITEEQHLDPGVNLKKSVLIKLPHKL